MSVFEVELRANRQTERSRPVALEVVEWERALLLSRRAGYAPPECGMAGSAVRCFAQALRNASANGWVKESDRGWMERLLVFLDAEGRGGFGVCRQWRSWRRTG